VKAFFLVFSDRFGTAAEVQGYLDTVPEVGFWFRCFPNGIFLTSSIDGKQLGRRLQARFTASSGTGRFILLPVDENESWGVMPFQAWKLVQEPDAPKLTPRDEVVAAYYSKGKTGGAGEIKVTTDNEGKSVATLMMDGKIVGQIELNDENKSIIKNLQELVPGRTKSLGWVE